MNVGLNLESGSVILLAAVRIGALVVVAPMFGSRWVAWRLRAGLIVVLTLSAMPTLSVTLDLSTPWVEMVGGEVLAGMLLGLGLRLVVMALSLAGDWLSQLTGWSLGQGAADQQLGVSPLARLFGWTMVGVFVAAGGPNQAIRGLLNSLRDSPPGSLEISFEQGTVLAALLQQSFELALRVAAPALLALVLATLLMAIVQRTAPSVNSFQVGFALKSVLAFFIASLVLAQGPNLISRTVVPTLERSAQVWERPVEKESPARSQGGARVP